MNAGFRLRVSLLGAGSLVGVAAASLGPAGCLIPDYCILFNAPGSDWCVTMPGAQMWPIGQPELAQPIKNQIFGAPKGCVCLNQVEQMILGEEVPEGAHAQLVAQIELAARNECASLVPLGWDSNCYLGAPNSPDFDTPAPGDISGACIGWCTYLHDPPGKATCGDDPNPFECNGEVSPPLPGGETGMGPDAETETGEAPDMGGDMGGKRSP
jgi:hypothetical protein